MDGLIERALPVSPAYSVDVRLSYRATPVPSRLSRLLFAVRVVRADLSNFFMLQYRSVDGFLITGKNSGTHWVKFMLSCAIAREFQVPPPVHSSGRAGDAIIGHPRWAPVHGHLPRIGSSHTIPSIAFAWRMRLLDHPPVVVFVRDIHEAMLSNYVKWRGRYNISLAEYVRGDPSGKRYIADVWWYIHFFNRWGAIARARPATTLIVHYEDLQTAPAYWLRRIATHLGVTLGDPAMQAALDYLEPAAIQAQLDTAYGETIIPDRPDRARIAYTPDDLALIDATLQRHLRHDLGYGYRRRTPRRAAAVDWLREAFAL